MAVAIVLQTYDCRVVCVWNLDELDASSLKRRNCLNDVVCPESNVLDSRSAKELNIFLDLTLLLAFSRFVDWHLDQLVGRGHDDGSKSGKLSRDVLVVHRPKPVEAKCLFVVVAGVLHLIPVLVTNAVVNEAQVSDWQKSVDGVGLNDRLKARQEVTSIVATLNKGVDLEKSSK